MSRDARDDRPDAQTRTPDRPADRIPSTDRFEVPTDHLRLPHTDRREPIEFRDQVYHLRGSQSRILATVGTFRVIPVADLRDGQSTPEAFNEDVRRLASQGLIERHSIPVNREATPVVVLTRTGKALLDSRQDEASGGRQQQYHAGLVKPRELAHDAQLHRLYQAEAGRLADDGARITRIVLDYELKREYQAFLNRPDRPEDTDRQEDLATFAATAQLPVIDGHLELPDLRIEDETPDGRLAYRDVELVTEHYSRAQLAGKARAGFGLYRAAGAGRGRGGPARTGGTPFDPHHLERLG